MQSFIDKLSTFEHRLSGSTQNRKAVESIRDTFKGYGFDTKLEEFRVPGTMFSRILTSIILLFIIFFLLQDFYLISLILYIFLLISLWGELNFSFNLLSSFFPGHKSVNLEAKPDSDSESLRRIIVVAHHDSPKTGLIYNVADWLAPKQAKAPEPFNRMFVLPYLAAVCLGFIILFRPYHLPGWILIAPTLASIIIVLVILFIMLNMVFSENSPGANDNGSGLIVLMELTRRFSGMDREHIPATFLSTGAEEVGLTGIKNYIKQHPELDKSNTLFINFECLGGGTLHWAIGEYYFTKVDYPQKGIEFIEEMEAKNIIPILPKVRLISPTDASPLAKNGFNVVTLIGLNKGVVPSNYHRVSDTFDKLDCTLLSKSTDIVESIIRNFN